MKEWTNFFKIDVPPDPTPAEVRQLLSHLNKLYQLADHYLRLARAAHQAAALNYKIAKGHAIHRVLSEWAGTRPPSRETAEQVAMAECAELHATLVNSELQVSFWEELIWQLKNQLEVIMTIQRSQAMETKIGGVA